MKGFIRQTIGFTLLALLLVKVCLMPFIYLDFELRRDYIISTLCENRLKPKLQCNGKCYLAKKIAEAQKEQEKQSEQNFLSKTFAPIIELPSIFRSDFFEVSDEEYLSNKILFDFAGLNKVFQLSADIFHPPLSPSLS